MTLRAAQIVRRSLGTKGTCPNYVTLVPTYLGRAERYEALRNRTPTYPPSAGALRNASGRRQAARNFELFSYSVAFVKRILWSNFCRTSMRWWHFLDPIVGYFFTVLLSKRDEILGLALRYEGTYLPTLEASVTKRYEGILPTYLPLKSSKRALRNLDTFPYWTDIREWDEKLRHENH